MFRRSLTNSTVTDACADDAVIALAWILAIGNSVITHLCKILRTLKPMVFNSNCSREGDVYRLSPRGCTAFLPVKHDSCFQGRHHRNDTTSYLN
jgi:hypothetical protein